MESRAEIDPRLECREKKGETSGEKETRSKKDLGVADSWIVQDSLDQQSVEMIDQQDSLADTTQVDFLKRELTKIKDEKCILMNKLFTVKSKYEHLRRVAYS